MTEGATPEGTVTDRPIERAFEDERPKLWRFVRARIGEHVDAEDIVQDVFAELVLAHRLAKPIAHLSGWLFEVARNRIADRRRKDARHEAAQERMEFTGDGSLSPGPEVEIARSQLAEGLREALSSLPPDQRQVFIAHELEGRSFREISRRTGVNVNTLLSRKHRAVLHLRNRLRSLYDEYHD